MANSRAEEIDTLNDKIYRSLREIPKIVNETSNHRVISSALFIGLILFTAIFVSIAVNLMLFLETFINVYVRWEIAIILGLLLLTTFIFILLLLGTLKIGGSILKRFKSNINSKVEEILQYHNRLTSSIENTYNIDEVIETTVKLRALLESIPVDSFILNLLVSDKNLRMNLEELKRLEPRWVYLILLDLHEDLILGMKEQSENLEKAKENLKTNLGDKPELQGITALQSERLDQQIEAFEQLQKRVLVKV